MECWFAVSTTVHALFCVWHLTLISTGWLEKYIFEWRIQSRYQTGGNVTDIFCFAYVYHHLLCLAVSRISFINISGFNYIFHDGIIYLVTLVRLSNSHLWTISTLLVRASINIHFKYPSMGEDRYCIGLNELTLMIGQLLSALLKLGARIQWSLLEVALYMGYERVILYTASIHWR